MSSIQQYWEKYRDRKKSPGKAEIIEGILNNCTNDRISDLQGQINILEDRLVSLSRQIKIQQKDQPDEIFETMNKINKIDKLLEFKQLFDEKTSDIDNFMHTFTKLNWEEKVAAMISKSEQKLVKLFESKFISIEEKLHSIELKLKKKPKITEEFLNKRLEDLSQKSRKSSRSRSSDNIKKKLEEFSTVQDKLQKIVINTAEKLKKVTNPESRDVSTDARFNRSIEKITDLLKRYSKAQETLFSNVKKLEEKTKFLEGRFENSRSFTVSEPIREKAPSFSSIDDNFKLSFGSEEGCSKVKTKKRSKNLTSL